MIDDIERPTREERSQLRYVCKRDTYVFFFKLEFFALEFSFSENMERVSSLWL